MQKGKFYKLETYSDIKIEFSRIDNEVIIASRWICDSWPEQKTLENGAFKLSKIESIIPIDDPFPKPSKKIQIIGYMGQPFLSSNQGQYVLFKTSNAIIKPLYFDGAVGDNILASYVNAEKYIREGTWTVLFEMEEK